MRQQTKRPVFLNLLKVKLPLMGLVSIIHRVTGALLFISLPFLLYLLGLSLSSAEGFTRVESMIQTLPFQLAGLLLIWAMLHHLLAGLRFLLIDLDIGVDLQAARNSSLWVIASAVVLTFAAGWLL